MRHLGNKLLLYIICCYMMWRMGINIATFAGCILALSVTSLCTYFETAKPTSCILTGYSLIVLFYPAIGVFSPLLLYDANLYSKWKFSDSQKTLIDVLPIPFIFISSVWSLIDTPRLYLVPMLIIFSFSFLVSKYSAKIESLLSTLHHFQDESAESTLILEEQNKALIQKQNYDIHVATLSERNRIAREIHDNVGHMLTRSILQTGALKVINKDEALAEPLTDLNETLNTAMTSIRSSVHDLHDEAIDLKVVLDDIVSHVDSFSVHLDYDMGNDLPRDIKYAFITIVKEAINNIQKHSNATSAQIFVREHPGFYQLEIKDNGTNTKPISESGIGLSNMKERVNALHGNIQISNKNGFCIFISIMKG